jgi:arsenite methyltransferase
MSIQQSLADIRRYYGEVLQSSNDLKTGACCTIDAMPSHLRRLLDDVHPQV